VKACHKLGIDEIEAEVKDYSDLFVIESNRYRQKTWEEKLKEAEALEKLLKPMAKENIKIPTGGKKSLTLQKSAKSKVDVREETAKSLGISHDTLHKAKVIAKAKPELIKQIDAGKRTVHSAYDKEGVEGEIRQLRQRGFI